MISIRKVSKKEFIIFLRQFSCLYKSNLPLIKIMEILNHHQHHVHLKKILKNILRDIELGNSIAFSFSKYPIYFDFFICQLIEMGERSGTLEKALAKIVIYKEKSLALTDKVKHILFYPFIVVTITVLITLSILIWIIPRFAELFQNFSGSLPHSTHCIIILSYFLRTHFMSLLLVFAIFCSSLLYVPHLTVFQTNLLKFTLFKKVLFSRFAFHLGTTLGAGISLLEALKLLGRFTYSKPMRYAILRLQGDVLSGKSLTTAMKAIPFFPELLIQMIKVGEDSGSLESMLITFSEIYESEVDSMISFLSQLLEPLIILILGALIGGLVIVMYLPIFHLGTIV